MSYPIHHILPDEPQPWNPQRSTCFDDRQKWIEHARKCREIALAQAKRADEAERTAKVQADYAGEVEKENLALDAERDALKVKVIELQESNAALGEWKNRRPSNPSLIEALTLERDALKTCCAELELDNAQHALILEQQDRTLAQRDREVLALREVLHHLHGMIQIPAADWVLVAKINEAITSTTRAGEEAERRILEAAWERLIAAFPPEPDETIELIDGVKAAIVGTRKE